MCDCRGTNPFPNICIYYRILGPATGSYNSKQIAKKYIHRGNVAGMVEMVNRAISKSHIYTSFEFEIAGYLEPD